MAVSDRLIPIGCPIKCGLCISDGPSGLRLRIQNRGTNENPAKEKWKKSREPVAPAALLSAKIPVRAYLKLMNIYNRVDAFLKEPVQNGSRDAITASGSALVVVLSSRKRYIREAWGIFRVLWAEPFTLRHTNLVSIRFSRSLSLPTLIVPSITDLRRFGLLLPTFPLKPSFVDLLLFILSGWQQKNHIYHGVVGRPATSAPVARCARQNQLTRSCMHSARSPEPISNRPLCARCTAIRSGRASSCAITHTDRNVVGRTNIEIIV
ncbi:hypothetical protein EVAR_9144_1 [Eumeta japonica]|uniref:Uncharacterized protein n=1 Tax=Eumeta variegata TaxID=151549 RepID=A0A4C1TWD9_EUMVA|nr:hypothetical protein EVAR_9144_1 [Eumeta japonica]